jgi:equilibrative nucleoside transporter 1/2/3
LNQLFSGDQESERRSQQPVKLQPSWEENNLPEDELNFKNLNMDDASLQIHTPPDKYNLVYLTFLIHGIGVLMPWNMFITADKVPGSATRHSL